MFYLLNSFPNQLLPEAGDSLQVIGITEQEAAELLAQEEFISAVGHDSTAALYTERLGVDIKTNRIQVCTWNKLLIGLFTMSRRLNEGERWTEEEILQARIKWVLVTK